MTTWTIMRGRRVFGSIERLLVDGAGKIVREAKNRKRAAALIGWFASLGSMGFGSLGAGPLSQCFTRR